MCGLFSGSLTALQPEDLRREEFSLLDLQPPNWRMAPHRHSINTGKSLHLQSLHSLLKVTVSHSGPSSFPPGVSRVYTRASAKEVSRLRILVC